MSKNKKVLFIILIIQTIICVFPHIYGFLNSGQDYVFTGQFGPSNENNDTQCANCFYLTMGFKQSYDGALIIEDKFQGYDTYPKIIHLWWIIGGHLARWLGIDVLTFNLIQRWLWVMLTTYVVFKLSFSLFKNLLLSTFAVLFLGFTSFLLFYTPEGTVFVASIAAVVLPLAYLLLAALFYAIYRFLHSKVSLILVSIFTFELAFSYPYAIITFTGSVGLFFLYLLYTKQKSFSELLRFFVIAFTPAFLVIAYDYYLVFTDPRLVGSQAHVHSAPLISLLKGYLPFSFFAFLFGIKLFFKNTSLQYKNFWVYLYIFSACSFLFTQIPTKYLAFSMQMIVGIQLPLILFTLEYFRLYVKPKWHVLLLSAMLIFASIPSFDFYQTILYTIKNHNIPSYIEREIYDGLVWLDKNSSNHSQLFCMPKWSSYAGIYTGNRLYIGEDILFTPDYDNRWSKMENALMSTEKNDMAKFIDEEKIDYILYDSKMESLDKNQYLLDSFDVVFQNKMMKILRVDKKEGV